MKTYFDGRPVAEKSMLARDHGVVLRHGDQWDRYGARDVWVFAHEGKLYMHYDAAGPQGWLAALAVSDDGLHWTKHGSVLELGKAGSDDSASASYGSTYYDGKQWHMFYLGTPNCTPFPDCVPAFPYLGSRHFSLPFFPRSKRSKSENQGQFLKIRGPSKPLRVA